MSESLRIGVVGAGMIAGVIAEAATRASGVFLQAVASRRQHRAQAFADQRGISEVFADWQALVGSETIDAVYVATPTLAREAVCLAAAGEGKHVLGEKPFASLPSVQRITQACRDNQVAFMDATHFVHHPRTAILKSVIRERLGTPLALRSAFFGPNSDSSNIRYDRSQEPMGAIGDLAWYCMRAIAEFLPEPGMIEDVQVTVRRDPGSQAVVRAAGVLRFATGSTATWDVGFDANTLLMDLDVIGSDAVIKLDDFVLDWAAGFRGPDPEPEFPVGFSLRSGAVTPRRFEWRDTPAAKPQSVLMLEGFAALAGDPGAAAALAAMVMTERTQELLDAVWAEAERRR